MAKLHLPLLDFFIAQANILVTALSELALRVFYRDVYLNVCHFQFSCCCFVVFKHKCSLFVSLFSREKLNFVHTHVSELYQSLPLSHYQVVLSFQFLVYCKYLYYMVSIFSQFLIFSLLHVFDVIKNGFWDTILCFRFESSSQSSSLLLFSR